MENPALYTAREKIAEMEAALLASDPRMPYLLRDIKLILKKDPDVVTLLSEEDIAKIFRGLEVVTNTELLTTKPTVSKAKIAKLGLDDL